MSEQSKDGLYVFQPFGMQDGKERWEAGRIYAISGLSMLATIKGLTRSEAEAVLAALVAPAEPQTREPLKYSACRICGRGPTTMGQHIAIASHGVHTDANGKPNQPNRGTAYCDRCEDETLVIQTAAPVSSSARPDSQTEDKDHGAGLIHQPIPDKEGKP